MKKFFTSIWGLWILLTIIYVVGLTSFQELLGIDLPSSIVFFVGLFVPFGIWNTLGLASIKTFWVLPLVLGVMFMMGKKIKNMNLGTIQRVLMGLVVLLFLTAVVDLVIWQKWCSWLLLVDSGGCGAGW